MKRSPWTVPAAIAAAEGLMLAANPQRLQVVKSLAALVPFAAVAGPERLVPLTPRGVVPTGFAAATLWAFALLAVARLATGPRLRAGWRVWGYGGAVLMLWAAFGGILWATGLEALLGHRWGRDGWQGLTLLAFLFAYVACAAGELRFWYRDLEARCPVCLRRLAMPQARGKAQDVLVAPLETETICLHGHGRQVASHWGGVFTGGTEQMLS